MLPAHDPIPLERIVSAFEYELPDFDEGRLASGSVGEPFLRTLLPEAALPIDTPDLLLEHSWVPLGVKLHDDAAGFVQIESFTSNLTLGDEYSRRRSRPVESGLNVPTC